MTTDEAILLPRRGLIVAGAALFAAACAVIKTDAPSLYTLNPARSFGAETVRADWQLSVETPVSPGLLDTARIVAIRGRTAVEPFADVSWTDRAPAMIQSLIVESFENSRRILSVGRDTLGLRADFLLKTELRDFEAEYDGTAQGMPARVRVRLVAKLVSMPRRVVDAGEIFEAERPVTGGDFGAVVAAFDRAMTDVLARLVDWTLATGNTMSISQRREAKSIRVVED